MGKKSIYGAHFQLLTLLYMTCEHKNTQDREFGKDCYVFCNDCQKPIRVGGKEIFKTSN